MFTFMMLILTVGLIAMAFVKTKKIISKKTIWAIIPLAFAIISIFVVIIPANHVGIKYSPLTGVKTDILNPGLEIKAPFDKIVTYPTNVQEVHFENVYCQTKDGQYVTCIGTVKYQVNPADAYKVFTQYKSLKNVESQFIPGATLDALESVTTSCNVFEVMGEKKQVLKTEAEIFLSNVLAVEGIKLHSITLSDVDAGDDIENAIKAEAIARQQVQEAEQKKAKAEIEAQERVIEAQANYDKAVIEAETKIVEAQAEAEANKLISASITPELIAMKEAEARLVHGWVEITGSEAVVVK